MFLSTPLTTPRLLLREFEEEDWRATHLHESDPEVVRYGSSDVRTPEQSREYIQHVRALARETPRSVYDLAMVRRDEGRLMGRCGMRITEREAMIWYVVERAGWSQGYATEAASTLVDWAFKTLGLHRVWADCDPRNPGSFRVMEKLGMRREAHFRENVFLKGEWCDSLIYALLAREWSAR